jgi:hypothetical protein
MTVEGNLRGIERERKASERFRCKFCAECYGLLALAVVELEAPNDERPSCRILHARHVVAFPINRHICPHVRRLPTPSIHPVPLS